MQVEPPVEEVAPYGYSLSEICPIYQFYFILVRKTAILSKMLTLSESLGKTFNCTTTGRMYWPYLNSATAKLHIY